MIFHLLEFLTAHCGLMPPYEVIALGNIGSGNGFGVWWHQAISSTNNDPIISEVPWHSSEGNLTVKAHNVS